MFQDSIAWKENSRAIFNNWKWKSLWRNDRNLLQGMKTENKGFEDVFFFFYEVSFLNVVPVPFLNMI